MSKQFSLGALMAAVGLICVGLAMARLVPVPDFSAVDRVVWGGLAMLAGIACATTAGVRWLNS